MGVLIKDLVSVIMTNYNTPEKYLREALDSILNQTYTNFEFIIVDDGSTDNSLSVIESYADSRIIVLKNDENIGLTKSLNKALEISKGEYVARMDSDDISEPERFEKQVNYLRKNDNVVVCGTWARNFGDWKKYNSNEILCRKIPDRETFRIFQLFGNNPNIVHISAMFNHRLMRKYSIKYNEKYIYAQDYRMWVSCSRYCDCYILPEVLVNIRVRSGTISTAKKDIQNECVCRIIQEQLDQLHLDLTEDIKPYHIQLLTSRKPFDLRIKKWMKQVIEANKQYGVYNQQILQNLLNKKWVEICYFSLAEKKNLKQIFGSLSIRYYPHLIYLYFQRKRKKNNG